MNLVYRAGLLSWQGGSGFAVGLSIREVVHAIALDSRRVLPVSTLQQGAYGVRDVCLSVPTVIGCGGARQQVELALNQKERIGIQQSAKVLRETIDQVEQRLGESKPGQAPAMLESSSNASSHERFIPRSAWQKAARV